MLLKLVELRSSDWGRVRAAAAASNATPDNDPNYFMVNVSFVLNTFFTLSPLLFVMDLFCFFPLRMNLHSTQKMARLSPLQTQVRQMRGGQHGSCCLLGYPLYSVSHRGHARSFSGVQNKYNLKPHLNNVKWF